MALPAIVWTLLLPLAPQDPPASPSGPGSAPAAEAPNQGGAPAVCADPLEVATLQRLEQGKALDFAACDALTRSANAAVAARATWLLGRAVPPTTAAHSRLCELATAAVAPEVRVQAMAALLRAGQRDSLDAALAGLDDPDPRVRTCAAQLLGRIAEPRGAAGLLAFLAKPAPVADAASRGTPATDAVAALLALHDLGLPEHLLPAAAAVAGSGHQHLGHALAYLFQDLTPKLAPAEEAKTLAATLAHPEPLLRKFALTRLAALADPHTAPALERCLATEGPALRPLAEAALAAAQRRQPGGQTSAMSDAFLQLRSRWQQLPERSQWATLGLLGLFGVAGIAAFVTLLGRRARRAAIDQDALAALTQPSTEHLEHLAAEAEAEAAQLAADAAVEAAADDELAEAATEALAAADDMASADSDWSTGQAGLDAAEDQTKEVAEDGALATVQEGEEAVDPADATTEAAGPRFPG